MSRISLLLYFVSGISMSFIALGLNTFFPLLVYLILSVIVRRRGLQFLDVIFTLNITFNVFLYFVYIWKYGAPYFVGGSDGLFSFELPAKTVLQLIDSLNYIKFNVTTQLSTGSGRVVGYVYVVAVIMKGLKFFGLSYAPFYPIMLNTLLLTGSTYFLFKISVDRLGFSFNKARLVALIFGLFPLVMFVNSHVWRDSLFNFLLILIIYYSYSKSVRSKVFIFVLILIMTQLRLEYAVVILLFWISVPIIERRILSGTRDLNTLVINVAMILCIAISIYVIFASSSYLQSQLLRTSGLDEYRSASGLTGVIFTLPWYLKFPLKLFYLIIMPYPGIGTIEQAIQGTGTLVQIIFTPVVFYSAYKASKDKRLTRIVLWFVLFFFLIGMGTVDFKHKPSLIIFGSILCVHGLQYFKLIRK